MSSPKKHPLEIFRGRGGHGPLIRPATPATPSTPPTAEDAAGAQAPAMPGEESPRARRTRAVSEFELRLNLPGAVILVVVWVVLLGFAHYYGYVRGEKAAERDRESKALERGSAIEGGRGADASSGPDANDAAVDVPKPWGVQIASLPADDPKLVDLTTEMQTLLADKYNVKGLGVFMPTKVKGGMATVFVGEFESKEDRSLQDLALKLRNIKDWPRGKDPSPFKNALIRQWPYVPGATHK